MINAFIGDLNVKRLWVVVPVMFVFVFATDFIIHGWILAADYEATQYLWRPKEDMSSYFWLMLVGQFIVAKSFTIIFAKGYQNKGLMEGVRYGIFVGSLFLGSYCIQYAVTPLTCKIITTWIIGAYAQAILGGMLLTKIYSK